MKSDLFVQTVYVVNIWCIYICCYNNDVSVSKRLSHTTTESCQCENVASAHVYHLCCSDLEAHDWGILPIYVYTVSKTTDTFTYYLEHSEYLTVHYELSKNECIQTFCTLSMTLHTRHNLNDENNLIWPFRLAHSKTCDFKCINHITIRLLNLSLDY